MNTKRLIASLAAAGVTAVSSLVSVSAATDEIQSVIDPLRDGSLTICKLKTTSSTVKTGSGFYDPDVTEEGMEGIVFSTRKIAAYETVADQGTVQTLFTGLDAEFIQLLEDNDIELETVMIGDTAYYTPMALSNALDALNSVTGAVPGEVQVNNWMREGGTALPATNSMGETFQDIPAADQGLYLVAETDCSAYKAGVNGLAEEVVYKASSPFLAAVPMTGVFAYDDGETYADAASYWIYDVTVYPKNQTVSIPKFIVSTEDDNTLVQAEDAAIGDVIEEIIAAGAPAVVSASNAYEKYVIKDTMDAGMSFVSINSVKYGTEISSPSTKDAFSSFRTLTENTDYVFALNEDDHSFTVTFLEAGLTKLNALTENAQVVVDFNVILNADAEDGSGLANENTPQLTWKNLSTLETSVEGNKPKLYTYRIDLTKTGVEDASNVGFTIKSGFAFLNFVEDEAGIYHVFTSEDDAESKVKELRPSAAGKLIVRGLDEGKYMFEETRTESGHDLLSTRFVVVLEGDEPIDGALASAKIAASDLNGNPASDYADAVITAGTASITVNNNESFVLHTGGSGTTMIYICGGLLIAAALALKFASHRNIA